MKLYELTSNYSELLNLLDEGSLEPAVIADTLDSIKGPLQEKTENTVKVLQHLENNDVILQKEIERLQQKRRTNKNNINHLKNYLRDSLDLLEEPKVKTPLFNVWVQNNPPTLVVRDEKHIPEEYFIPQPSKLDRRRLLKDLKAGGQIDGVAITQTRGVRIR